MNLPGMQLDSRETPALGHLTSAFGVNEGDAKNALCTLAPARDMQNAVQQNGLGDLLGALAKGQHQRYVDQPDTVTTPQATEEGNAILGHLLGSKDVSRRVTRHAAAQTGLLKRMLPVDATLMMGMVSKQAGSQNLPGGIPWNTGGIDAGGLLTQFLDADTDGSVLDDLMGLARKFL